jgi:hypothetical protein
MAADLHHQYDPISFHQVSQYKIVFAIVHPRTTSDIKHVMKRIHVLVPASQDLQEGKQMVAKKHIVEGSTAP